MTGDLPPPSLRDDDDEVATFVMLLADASFDDIMAMVPALVLQAVPVATCTELQVTRPGRRRPVSSSAYRDARPAVSVVPPGTHVLALQICLASNANAGVLRLSTQSEEAFAGSAAVTAAVLTSQVESALDRADARENATHLEREDVNNRDVGVAIGLVMASQELDRDAALQVLRDISYSTNRQLADIAAHVIEVGESGKPPTGLRLVDQQQVRANASLP